MRPRLLIAALAVVAGAAAACSSSGGAAPVTSPAGPPSSTSVTSPSAPATATPSTSAASTSASAPVSVAAPPSSTAAAPAPSSSSAPAPSSSAPPTPPPNACTAAQLRVIAIRGGASEGVEYAGVVFTNISSARCAMRGYPAAQLRRAGRPLGKPAYDNPATTPTIELAPGRSAQAQLKAVSTCQAPLSDHVLVRAPWTLRWTSLSMQLRGCALSVDPVERG